MENNKFSEIIVVTGWFRKGGGWAEKWARCFFESAENQDWILCLSVEYCTYSKT
jgi:hypothetical protein